MNANVTLALPTGRTLTEILDGGQCFRWNRDARDVWRGVSGGCAAELIETADGVRARVLAGTIEQLQWHLATDIDWSGFADRLPWRTDEHLAACRRAFPGLRILRQPLAETLLCFICSATKQIAQIKQMAEQLAARFGSELAPGLRALPTWAQLRDVTEQQLRACQLGFRARHVHGVARFLARHPGWLEETSSLPYPEAHARLTTLPGVGAKIADCALLFGAGRLEAFPVDVWILRAMARHYHLTGWRNDQIAHFGRVHFGSLAGLAQQFLFAWERAHRVPVKAGTAARKR